MGIPVNYYSRVMFPAGIREFYRRVIPLCLGATLLVWGLGLLPGYTYSPSFYLGPDPTCRAADAQGKCVMTFRDGNYFWDPLAPAAQELPAEQYLHWVKREVKHLPAWNPYIGSGYPIGYDQINFPYSPARWLLRTFPYDQTHDIVIFLRMLIWVTGITAAAYLLGLSSRFALFVTAAAASAAPYFTSHVDIIFLDVEAMAPWFFVAVFLAAKGKRYFQPAAALALLTGALIGLLGFPQAQICLGFALFVSTIALTFDFGWKPWGMFLCLAVGGLLTAPLSLPTIKAFSGFFSSRSFRETCVASYSATNWRGVWDVLIIHPLGSGSPIWFGSAAGLFLILSQLTRSRAKFLFLAWVTFTWIVVCGMPEWYCRLPVVSGLRFGRHLFPSLQAVFLILAGYSVQVLAYREDKQAVWSWRALFGISCALIVFSQSSPGNRVDLLMGTLCALRFYRRSRRQTGDLARRRRAVAASLLALLPAFLASNLFSRQIRYRLPEQAMAAETRQVVTEPFRTLAEVSAREDRRHFSSQPVMYPNWSGALGILDLRVINGVYPRRYYELNTGLFSDWGGKANPFPDRFAEVAPSESIFSEEFQRVLILHRVSLISFFRAEPYFASGADSPYTAARCQRLLSGRELETYRCPAIGGVGFFPRSVHLFPSQADELAWIKQQRPAALVDVAALVTTESGGESEAAVGQVLAVKRAGDELVYQLDVKKRGLFAISDTYFAGWQARVNGQPAPVLPVNIAFKAVPVPVGEVTVALEFKGL